MSGIPQHAISAAADAIAAEFSGLGAETARKIARIALEHAENRASIPQAAIDAGAQALDDDGILPGLMTFDGGVRQRIARHVLEATEEVWPHQPPSRDPASTAGSVTERAWSPTMRPHGQAFGFSRDRM